MEKHNSFVNSSREKETAPEVAGAVYVKKNGGQNKEKILITINTFKKLCLKSNTKKADEIHDYFIKLEEVFQEIISEESIELKNQLEQKQTQLQIKDENLQKLTKEKLYEKHNILLRE
jgi:hypothetical protein